MSEKQTHQMDWQGIALSVTYDPEPWKSFREVYGWPLAHLSIKAPCPIPISVTGYQSRYIAASLVEAEGGPVAFMVAWMDHEAQRPEWKAQQAATAQLSLF